MYLVYTYLIFIKLAIFVRRFSFLLEGNDDKTNKDIDHKEGYNNNNYNFHIWLTQPVIFLAIFTYDDNINEIENSHNGSIIVNWSNILSIGIDRYV